MPTGLFFLMLGAFLGIIWIGSREWQNNKLAGGMFSTLFAFVVVLAMFVIHTYTLSKPFTKLKDGAVYTMYAETDDIAYPFQKYTYMLLGDGEEKEPKLYKILSFDLRDPESHEPFCSPPRKFKVKKGTIPSTEGVELSRKGTTLEVYFIIPVE